METYLGFLSEPPEGRGVAVSGGVGSLSVPCPVDVHSSSFFFLSLFLATPGLCWCTQIFSDCAEWGYCLAAVLRLLGHTGFVAPRHLGSSRTRDRTHIPLHGQAVLNPWATREVPDVHS